MAAESDVKPDVPTNEDKDSGLVKKKKQRGLFSRIWNRLFNIRDDDFEKKLKHIKKEEDAILARIRRRSQSWRGFARNIIVFSVILEVVAVGYAIMTTRTLELDWKTRALRVLPMFLLPALSTAAYLGFGWFTNMRIRQDQSNLERVRAEKQGSLDELKEIKNFYGMLEIIQKYDPDPAAKTAAATILASRLGAVCVNNESTGRSNDVELVVNSSGLRHRRQMLSNSDGSSTMQQTDEDMLQDMENMGPENTNQVITEHYQPGSTPHDGGWFARAAALLVGEDPTQCYALICGNCHMHNGLARKEDFPYITYYCPHCKALNRSNNPENTSDMDPPSISSSVTTGNINPVDNSTAPLSDNELVRSSSVEGPLETTDKNDVSVPDEPKPVS